MAGLQMRKTSQWWYGRYAINGKTKVVNLQIKIRGIRPPTLKDAGSTQFENSRGQAQAKLDDHVRKIKDPVQAEKLAQAVYEARTGDTLEPVGIDEIPQLWVAFPRKRRLSKRYQGQSEQTLHRFVDFVEEHYSDVSDLHEITEDIARSFMTAEEARGVTAKTWNNTLQLLRGVFGKLSGKAGLMANPFGNQCLVSRETETAFRMPFSADELMAILEAAKTDALMEPIIIAAVCSAMRLGDCCRLRWQDIDEADGFMTVKTSKTRVTIDIPIFPMLYEQLEKHRGRNKTYVFPEQAEQYERNPGLLTTRLRKILWLAGFAGDDSDKGSNTERLIRHEVSPRKARTAVTRKLKNMPESSRKSRMSHALELYLDGNSLKQVASQTQLSQGTVHAYLKEVETETGICIVRGRLHKEKPKVHRGPIRETRTNGKRRASIRDFHSFRTTWITLALTSNLPMEIVRRVTGHTTVDVVLKHYFRPQRAELKKALTQNMPSLLTDGTMVTVHDQALTSLRTADDDNWRTVVDETIALLEGNRSSV